MHGSTMVSVCVCVFTQVHAAALEIILVSPLDLGSVIALPRPTKGLSHIQTYLGTTELPVCKFHLQVSSLVIVGQISKSCLQTQLGLS